MTQDETAITAMLHLWAERTRQDNKDEILANHDPQAVIYDVLPPLQYIGTKAYRDSWDDWQPDTVGEGVFELEGLQVVAAGGVGYAFGLLNCGGTTPDGKTFSDIVRVTFCLRKTDGAWRVHHQHGSMPMRRG